MEDFLDQALENLTALIEMQKAIIDEKLLIEKYATLEQRRQRKKDVEGLNR